MKNQSFEALKSFAISKSGMQGGEAKRNLPWSILEDSHCQPLLKYLLEFNLCMLYVVSKLGKLAIQCFKRCMIQSWNEGVTAIGSRSLKAEGQFRRAAKSAFGCEITRGWLRNGVLHAAKFRSHLARLRNSPEASRYLQPTFLRSFTLDIWCLNPQTLLVMHLS